MRVRAQLVAWIVTALALAHATTAWSQTLLLSDPFAKPTSTSNSSPSLAPLPRPIIGFAGDESSDADDDDDEAARVGGALFASFQAPTPFRSNNQSSSGNSLDAETAAEPQSKSRRPITSPAPRSSNQSSSANSVDSANAAEPQTGVGPAPQPDLGGSQTDANQSGSGYSASAEQDSQGFSGGAFSPTSAESAHSSTDELGTIRLPKEKPRPYKRDMPPRNRKVEAEFGDGLTAKTDDGYFSLTFHNLTQVDYRNFSPTGNPLSNNFLLPRQRWYVLGNVSPYARYYTVVNRGYNSIDLLDAFIDLNMGMFEKEKFQIRMGRMKTPYTYEYIKVSENDLIAPERSVFVGNLAPNREVGAMAHGQLLDKRFEYAVGVFNGARRSFYGFDNHKDLFTFFNSKPFLKSDGFLQQLNLGGSFNFGYEYGVTQPQAFRTASDQSPSTGANQVSPTFLQYGPNVFENGLRAQWSGDLAYYYKSLGVMIGYQGGVQNYGISPTAIPSSFVGVYSTHQVKVPMTGFEATVFYFITGEEITRRVYLLEPRSEFKGLRGTGTGAIEWFSRFANLQLGDSIFSGGLATPGIYTNRINVIDNGFNWYLNHYTKLTFDWQYSQYLNPVQVAPSKLTSHQNIFWLRAQIFF